MLVSSRLVMSKHNIHPGSEMSDDLPHMTAHKPPTVIVIIVCTPYLSLEVPVPARSQTQSI